MVILQDTKHLFRILIAVAVLFTSCLKNEATPVQLAGVSFIQAVPTTEKVNIFIGNDKVNEFELNFGNKLDYANVYPGAIKFTLSNAANGFILSEVLELEPQNGYSLFATGVPGDIKFLLLKDDLTKPEAGKARIRFVNLSPDAPAVDFIIEGQANELITNKKFKEYSTFETIAAGDNLTFNIKNTTNGSMVVNLTAIKVEAGKLYTFYIKGFYHKLTGSIPVSGSLFTHK